MIDMLDMIDLLDMMTLIDMIDLLDMIDQYNIIQFIYFGWYHFLLKSGDNDLAQYVFDLVMCPTCPCCFSVLLSFCLIVFYSPYIPNWSKSARNVRFHFENLLVLTSRNAQTELLLSCWFLCHAMCPTCPCSYSVLLPFSHIIDNIITFTVGSCYNFR